MGLFEFKISFSTHIYLGDWSFDTRIIFWANYLSGARISNFVLRTINDFPVLEGCPAGGVDIEKYLFLHLIDVLQVTEHLYVVGFEHQEDARALSFEECCRVHLSMSQMDVWKSSHDHLGSFYL